jgi:cytochrome c556
VNDSRPILKQAALGAVLLAAGLGGVAVADDQDSIDYRQHIMKTIGEQAASITMILQHKAPAENLATHAKLLALSAATAKKAFEPKAPGGNSKPEVWSNWSDFSKRLDAFVAATDDLAKAAASGGVAAAGAKSQAALACTGCHDQYMSPKK